MVDKPNPIPPNPNSQPISNPKDSAKTEKIPGGMNFGKGEHKFAGMNFSEKDWNKLMNVLFKNLGEYINKTYQKMTEKLKKDWKRARGEDAD